MVAPGIFNKWVPNIVRIPVLLFLYFVTLNFKGVFQGNTTDIFSDLGVYSETYTAAYNAIYIGMGAALMIHMRLAARFPVKTLILYGLTVQLLMHVVCAMSPYPPLTILACFLLGFGKAAAMKELYNFWAAIWSREGDRGRIYPFVFTLGLAGTFLIYWGMTRLAILYNWQYAYVPIISCLSACILMAYLFFEHHPLHRPLPLYQMDGPGVSLLCCFLMLINYIGVYGQAEDWLNSPRIQFALILAPAAGLGFLLQEATVRRPVLPLRLFCAPHYLPGLFLFLTTGLYVPAAVQFLYSQEVLRLELGRAVELNLFLIPGVVIGAVWAWLWYRFKLSPLVLICAGMLACIGYNVLFYQQLTAAEGLQDFWLPSIFKGMGICILYISLGIQTTKRLPLKDLPTGIGFMILIRSFLGRGIFSAAFTYLLYSGRMHHLNNLAGQLDPGWRYRWHGAGAYTAFMQREAYLAAAKELTGGIILTGLVIVVALAVWGLIPVFNRFRIPSDKT
jgi:hypothetical protein